MEYRTAIGIIGMAGSDACRMMKFLRLLDYAGENKLQVRESYSLRKRTLKATDLQEILKYMREEAIDVLLITSLSDITVSVNRLKQINNLFVCIAKMHYFVALSLTICYI